MKKTEWVTPRRNRIDLLTPAERAIYDAVQAVENLPADPILTDAVILLSQARDKVADYVDNANQKKPPLDETEFNGSIDVIGKCANCGVEFHIHK